MQIKTIFLDRDGVINLDLNYLSEINDFKFIDGVFDACKHFIELGYKIVIVTNQSGIARGYFSNHDFKILTRWMLLEFESRQIDILDIFYCPHAPNDNCSCRKPMPGMFLKAQKKYNIDMKNSWIIGDKEEDIIAANNSGIKNTIIVKSGHKVNENSTKAKFILNSIHDSIQVIIN